MRGFPGGPHGKEPTCQCRRHKRHRFHPYNRKIPWSKKWQPTPVFLPGKFHGQRMFVAYSPWGHKELDDYSHEIKRHLLLGRKAMTNLDSVLKSRDISLMSTEVCIVKSIVFLVVMYEYESWSVKNAKHPRIDAFNLWCWRKFLTAP